MKLKDIFSRRSKARKGGLAPKEGAASVDISTICITHQFMSQGPAETAPGYTYHASYETESDFDLVRLIIINNTSHQFPIDNAIVASTASLSNLIDPVDGEGRSDAWKTVTRANRGQDGPYVEIAKPGEAMHAQSVAVKMVGNGTPGPYVLPNIPFTPAGIYLFSGSVRLTASSVKNETITFSTSVEKNATIAGYILVLASAQSTTSRNAAPSLAATDMPITASAIQYAYAVSDWIPK